MSVVKDYYKRLGGKKRRERNDVTSTHDARPGANPFTTFTEPHSDIVIPPEGFPKRSSLPYDLVRLDQPVDITTLPSTTIVWEKDVAIYQWGRIIIDCLCASASTSDPLFAYVEVHEAIGALTYMTAALFVGEQSSDPNLDTGPIVYEIAEGRMPQRIIVKASYSKLVAAAPAAGDAGTLFIEGIMRR